MSNIDPFVAQNTIMAFLAISAFAFAGAAFFKDTILKNVLGISKSFTQDDLVRQNEIFEDITAPGFYDASDIDTANDIGDQTRALRKRLRKLAKGYKKSVKEELEHTFNNCRLYTFSFGVFALGYIFLISLFLQGIFKDHFIIYLYTFMYIFFTILLYIYDHFVKYKPSSLVAYCYVYFKNYFLQDSKDKTRIINAYKKHYLSIIKYILHFLFVLLLMYAAYYTSNNYPGLKKEIASMLVSFDILQYCSPLLLFVSILLYYLFRTLIVPFFVLDRRSSVLLVNYSNNRNIEWKKHEEIIKNKTKRDNIVNKIETLKGKIESYLKDKQ